MFMLLLEIITIGLPFCSFKIISGIFFNQHWLLALGAIDLIFNMINFFSVIFLNKRVLDVCLFSLLVRKIKRPVPERSPQWEDFGNSLDVFFSFLLVAYVIGGGVIPSLPERFLAIWNVSVILNVIGAGSSRISASIRSLKSIN